MIEPPAGARSTSRLPAAVPIVPPASWTMVGLASLIGTKPNDRVLPAYSGSVRSIGVGVAFEVSVSTPPLSCTAPATCSTPSVSSEPPLTRVSVPSRRSAELCRSSEIAFAETTPSKRFVACVAVIAPPEKATGTVAVTGSL